MTYKQFINLNRAAQQLVVEHLRPDFTTWVATPAGITGRDTIPWDELANITPYETGFATPGGMFLPIEEEVFQ